MAVIVNFSRTLDEETVFLAEIMRSKNKIIEQQYPNSVSRKRKMEKLDILSLYEIKMKCPKLFYFKVFFLFSLFK